MIFVVVPYADQNIIGNSFANDSLLTVYLNVGVNEHDRLPNLGSGLRESVYRLSSCLVLGRNIIANVPVIDLRIELLQFVQFVASVL